MHTPRMGGSRGGIRPRRRPIRRPARWWARRSVDGPGCPGTAQEPASVHRRVRMPRSASGGSRRLQECSVLQPGPSNRCATNWTPTKLGEARGVIVGAWRKLSMVWAFAASAVLFGWLASKTGGRSDRPMLIAIAVLSAVFMIAAIMHEPDPRFNTSGCTRISRIWSWMNCGDDEIMCRTHVLEPRWCMGRVVR